MLVVLLASKKMQILLQFLHTNEEGRNMKKKSLILIFAALITMSLAGCGSSSSSNPVSSNSMNSGLVSVSGNVKNLEGNGTVSFYTPTAIYVNNTAPNSNFRTSIANNDVYTFNVDESGNYSGSIPSGDYYVIAQNSDGSMKAATAKQSLRCSEIAEGAESSGITINFDLVPTKTITGTLTDESETLTSESDLPFVYIEGKPFVAKATIDNEVISFTLKDVPIEDSYTICSDMWIENFRYHFSTTYSDFTKPAELSNPQPISISGKNIKMQLVTPDDGSPFQGGTAIAFLTQDNIVFPSHADDNGYFYLPVESLDEITCLYIYGDIIKNSDIKPDDDGNIKIPVNNCY